MQTHPYDYASATTTIGDAGKADSTAASETAVGHGAVQIPHMTQSQWIHGYTATLPASAFVAAEGTTGYASTGEPVQSAAPHLTTAGFVADRGQLEITNPTPHLIGVRASGFRNTVHAPNGQAYAGVVLPGTPSNPSYASLKPHPCGVDPASSIHGMRAQVDPETGALHSVRGDPITDIMHDSDPVYAELEHGTPVEVHAPTYASVGEEIARRHGFTDLRDVNLHVERCDTAGAMQQARLRAGEAQRAEKEHRDAVNRLLEAYDDGVAYHRRMRELAEHHSQEGNVDAALRVLQAAEERRHQVHPKVASAKLPIGLGMRVPSATAATTRAVPRPGEPTVNVSYRLGYTRALDPTPFAAARESIHAGDPALRRLEGAAAGSMEYQPEDDYSQ